MLKDSNRLFSDELTVSDINNKSVFRSFSDVLSLSENLFVSKLYYEFLADVFNLNDAIYRNTNAVRSDVYSVSDSVLKGSARTLADVYNESDVVTKLTILNKLDQLIMNDGSTGIGYARIFSDVLGLSDAVIAARSLFLNDAFTVTDSESQVRGKWFLDTFNLAEAAPTFITKNAFSKFRSHLDYIFTSVPFAEEVTWTRYSNTEDELGRASAITQVFSTDISLIVQPLVDSDRSLVPQGVQISGYMKAYSKDSYAIGGGSYATPDVADQIVLYNGKKYIVDSVQGKWIGNSEIYRKLILKRIDND